MIGFSADGRVYRVSYGTALVTPPGDDPQAQPKQEIVRARKYTYQDGEVRIVADAPRASRSTAENINFG